VIETAGRYLRSTIPGEPLPRGLGARHKSAAAITAATHAVAITVSESTGTVTVYEQGKMLFEIEKPRPIGPLPHEVEHIAQQTPHDGKGQG
jgi:DNA integrity scanning protein DisA with diadenylate cyclase activity